MVCSVLATGPNPRGRSLLVQEGEKVEFSVTSLRFLSLVFCLELNYDRPRPIDAYNEDYISFDRKKLNFQ